MQCSQARVCYKELYFLIFQGHLWKFTFNS